MERTGAGLLVQATVDNQKYFLLGRDRRDTWSDLGGQKRIGEATIQTAARVAFHESRGVLGDMGRITQQLRRHVIETVTHKTYRLFVCGWPFIELPAKKGQKHKLKWIPVEEVYRAVSKSSLFNRVKVRGKYLRERIVEMVSRSKAYHHFLKHNPELVTCHPINRVIIGTRNNGKNLTQGIVPLVVLHDENGRISRIIAVIKNGSAVNELQLEDRSFLSPEFPVGIYGTISNLARNVLTTSRLTTHERWAVWLTLQREESFIRRARREILDVRCQLGLVSFHEANLIQHPLAV
ncbi:MAG: hypothetical protein Q8K75_07705 [Chlamydiales bacterium]|nr:hypothetical protein [Chlamydiales bacterium]